MESSLTMIQVARSQQARDQSPHTTHLLDPWSDRSRTLNPDKSPTNDVYIYICTM